MSYLKYEKNLYELNNEQEEIIKKQIQRGGRINIGRELLFANKCEVISDLPHNKDEYQIKFLNFQLEGEDYYHQVSREHAENMKRWLAQTPEEKAERSFRLIFITKWELRHKRFYPKEKGFNSRGGNEPEIYKMFCEEFKSLKDEFFKIAIPFFEKNQNRAWFPAEEYESLLPKPKEITIKGWKSVGELVENKF